MFCLSNSLNTELEGVHSFSFISTYNSEQRTSVGHNIVQAGFIPAFMLSLDHSLSEDMTFRALRFYLDIFQILYRGICVILYMCVYVWTLQEAFKDLPCQQADTSSS